MTRCGFMFRLLLADHLLGCLSTCWQALESQLVSNGADQQPPFTVRFFRSSFFFLLLLLLIRREEKRSFTICSHAARSSAAGDEGEKKFIVFSFYLSLSRLSPSAFSSASLFLTRSDNERVPWWSRVQFSSCTFCLIITVRTTRN